MASWVSSTLKLIMKKLQAWRSPRPPLLVATTHAKLIKRAIKGSNRGLGKGKNGGKLLGIVELNSHKTRGQEHSTWQWNEHRTLLHTGVENSNKTPLFCNAWERSPFDFQEKDNVPCINLENTPFSSFFLLAKEACSFFFSLCFAEVFFFKFFFAFSFQASLKRRV